MANATSYTRIYNGITIVAQSSISPSGTGDLRYNTSTNKLELWNGALDPVVTETLAATLTNKVLTGNTAANLISGSGTLTLNTSGTITIPSTTDTLVGKATTDTLTNKTIAAGSNTITGLTNTNLSGSAGITGANLASNTVANSNLSQMAANTIKGNNTAGTANVSDLTTAQVQTMLSLSGTNSGDVTLAAVGSSPNTNGASLSGQVLTLQPADGTHSGLVSTSAQTLAGTKTFSGNIISNILDTNTNHVLDFNATASSINWATLTNAATGSGPTLSVTGSDSNIPLNLGLKGTTGAVNVLDDKGKTAFSFLPNVNGLGTSTYLKYLPGYSSGATSGNNPEFDVAISAGSPVTDQGVSFRGVGAWFHAFHSTATGKAKVKLYPANDESNGVLLTTANSMSTSYELALPPALGSTGSVLYDSGSGFTAFGTVPGNSTLLKAVTFQSFTSTGTITGYVFNISTTSTFAVGDTYTNNGHTYTILAAVSASNGYVMFTSGASAPTASGTLTRATGSGTSSITFTAATALATYTTPSSPTPLYLRIRGVAGGGGGAGSGTASIGAGGTGGITVFGALNIVALGGTGATNQNAVTGGASTLFNGLGYAKQGSPGFPGTTTSSGTVNSIGPGGAGGASPFGGAGFGGLGGNAGAAVANTGSGGGGAGIGFTASANCGGGGGSGGYFDIVLTNPAGTYVYCVGTGGTNGTAGTSGFAGTAGSDGFIVVEEHYQ